MAITLYTTPTGQVIEILDGQDAEAHMIRVARECATRGGVVAASVVADYDKAALAKAWQWWESELKHELFMDEWRYEGAVIRTYGLVASASGGHND